MVWIAFHSVAHLYWVSNFMSGNDLFSLIIGSCDAVGMIHLHNLKHKQLIIE